MTANIFSSGICSSRPDKTLSWAASSRFRGARRARYASSTGVRLLSLLSRNIVIPSLQGPQGAPPRSFSGQYSYRLFAQVCGRNTDLYDAMFVDAGNAYVFENLIIDLALVRALDHNRFSAGE